MKEYRRKKERNPTEPGMGEDRVPACTSRIWGKKTENKETKQTTPGGRHRKKKTRAGRKAHSSPSTCHTKIDEQEKAR